MELDYEKILSGIVVELVKGLAKLGMEEINKRLQKKDNPRKPKKRKSRNKNS